MAETKKYRIGDQPYFRSKSLPRPEGVKAGYHEPHSVVVVPADEKPGSGWELLEEKAPAAPKPESKPEQPKQEQKQPQNSKRASDRDVG